MPVKKYTVQDGIFVHEHTTASIKDTPTKEFGEDLKKSLEEIRRKETPEYILAELETYAQLAIKRPKNKRKKEQRLQVFKAELEAEERRRRDCETILLNIDYLKQKIKGKQIDSLLVQFYKLGVLAARADIRPVEPSFFRGHKNLEYVSEGGKAKAAYNCQRLEAKYSEWQKDAVKIKEEKPSYLKWRIAGILSDKYQNNPDLQGTQDWISRKIKI